MDSLIGASTIKPVQTLTTAAGGGWAINNNSCSCNYHAGAVSCDVIQCQRCCLLKSNNVEQNIPSTSFLYYCSGQQECIQTPFHIQQQYQHQYQAQEPVPTILDLDTQRTHTTPNNVAYTPSYTSQDLNSVQQQADDLSMGQRFKLDVQVIRQPFVQQETNAMDTGICSYENEFNTQTNSSSMDSIYSLSDTSKYSVDKRFESNVNQEVLSCPTTVISPEELPCTSTGAEGSTNQHLDADLNFDFYFADPANLSNLQCQYLNGNSNRTNEQQLSQPTSSHLPPQEHTNSLQNVYTNNQVADNSGIYQPHIPQQGQQLTGASTAPTSQYPAVMTALLSNNSSNILTNRTVSTTNIEPTMVGQDMQVQNYSTNTQMTQETLCMPNLELKCEDSQQYQASNSLTNSPISINTENVDGSIECTLCTTRRKFTSDRYFKQHFNSKHVVGNSNIKCEICGKRFKTKNDCDRHSIKHSKDQHEFHCKICSNSYVYKHDLRRHEANHDETMKKYVCGICDKKFQRRDHFYKHKLTHILKHQSEQCNGQDSDSNINLE